MTKDGDKTETFVPVESFLGFPPGSGSKGVNFIAGVESAPLPAKFVALMREKGLAERSQRAVGQVLPKEDVPMSSVERKGAKSGVGTKPVLEVD